MARWVPESRSRSGDSFTTTSDRIPRLAIEHRLKQADNDGKIRWLEPEDSPWKWLQNSGADPLDCRVGQWRPGGQHPPSRQRRLLNVVSHHSHSRKRHKCKQANHTRSTPNVSCCRDALDSHSNGLIFRENAPRDAVMRVAVQFFSGSSCG